MHSSSLYNYSAIYYKRMHTFRVAKIISFILGSKCKQGSSFSIHTTVIYKFKLTTIYEANIEKWPPEIHSLYLHCSRQLFLSYEYKQLCTATEHACSTRSQTYRNICVFFPTVPSMTQLVDPAGCGSIKRNEPTLRSNTSEFTSSWLPRLFLRYSYSYGNGYSSF